MVGQAKQYECAVCGCACSVERSRLQAVVLPPIERPRAAQQRTVTVRCPLCGGETDHVSILPEGTERELDGGGF